MAIKGLLYPKTTWDFEERPVKSAKLNAWDDRIEAALELCSLLLANAWGGGDGVVGDEFRQKLRPVGVEFDETAAQVVRGQPLIHDGQPP